VLAGALQGEEGISLPALYCVFVPPDEAPFAASAGHGGAEIPCLQFPVVTTAGCVGDAASPA
jgi:hypothetical protein